MRRVAATSKQQRLQFWVQAVKAALASAPNGPIADQVDHLPSQAGTTVGGYEGDTPSYRCPQIPRVHNHPSLGAYRTTVTLSTLSTTRQGAL